MIEYIEINGEKYPLRFDTWSLMHLEKYTKKNIFLYLKDTEAITSSEFLVNLTYSGIFGGLDLDDDKDMTITRKEIARNLTPLDFEVIITVFGKQMAAKGGDVKKKKPEKVNP